ncbi:MAG: MFS transporter [Liquorilactobacillus nagelii]|uniref:MFS transporter n=1 Tax=Liquorilactobacillus nagelii TaxID=82688 RepID=UPI002432B036|nr:MFS transporter [Liquorilactobacillus nagelii]MCI1921671.1 MFS transporter [Liquorilactobacillus nagelii]MCI1976297.1 MFS transporter [Liquorilactobacillus nagelii]
MVEKQNFKLTLSVLLLGGFLSLFNETILNVALPKLMISFQVNAATVQWLSTGYILVVVVMVPLSAFLIRRFSTTQLFCGALTLFALGTFLAALSPNFVCLLGSRMLQATGTGLLVPIMMNTALKITPKEKKGFIMGVCTCVILFGPSLGPIVSGELLQFASWRILFWLLLSLILITILGGILWTSSIKIQQKKRQAPIDILSVILSSLGLVTIVYFLSIINSSAVQWEKYLLLAIGVISLIWFYQRQLKLDVPMLNVKLLSNKVFLLGAIILIMLQMVQFSMNILLPMIFENGLHLSPLATALRIFPATIICSLLTLVAGKVYDKFSGTLLIPGGLMIMVIGLAVMSRVTSLTSALIITLIDILIYFGISLSFAPNQSNMLVTLTAEEQTDAIAISNTFIQLGSALGTPLFVGILSGQEQKLIATGVSKITSLYSGFQLSIELATIILIIGVFIALYNENLLKKVSP